MDGTHHSNDPLLERLPQETRDRIAEMLRQGHKIEAIKTLREAGTCGLAEAKEAVERFEVELGLAAPGGRAAGCASALVAAAAVVALLALA